MSDAKEVSLFEQLKQQHAQFVAQRDQIQINFQQLVGAIAVCELIIKNHEEHMKKLENGSEEQKEKECTDEQINNQEPE